MSSSIREHIRSNVVGYLCLFWLMSGTAWAAGQIGASDIKDNAIHSNHIKNGQVKSADLGAGAVNASKVAANSLGGTQIDEASLDPAVLQQRVTGTCAGSQAVQSIDANGGVGCSAGSGGGTVTSVGSGTGLAGGPITSTGTLSVASSYRLPQSCTNNQVAKSNGAGVWNCAADTDTNTIYTAAANGGLSLTSNAFSLSPCTTGQILKATGATTWGCAADNSGGAPTGAASGDLTGTYPAPTIAPNAVNSAKVADNTLTGADIQNGSVAAADLAATPSQTVAAYPVGAANACPAQTGIFCGDSDGDPWPWENYGTSTDEGATFFKDLSGVVHLQGLVRCWGAADFCGNSPVIFYLPAGHRPAKNLVFGTDSTGSKHSRISIYPDGGVRWTAANGDSVSGYLSLSGITFRASQ
ncbi:MAG: hypothetical protein QOE58_3383 [Actinomycetota bacterium]|nr:hypothetical protein [Actinomycetota bacterium]